jgi:hypothetical protein
MELAAAMDLAPAMELAPATVLGANAEEKRTSSNRWIGGARRH